MKAVLNYRRVFKLQYGVSFSEPSVRDIAGDMMLSRYRSKQFLSSFIRYMSFGLLMTKNAEVLPLLESLKKSSMIENEMRISHPDR